MADDPRLSLLLSLADDELVIGHRHSEWTGWAPHLEEDLAFSSIAQDEMAHARLLFELASENGDLDALAFGREPQEYRNAVLCERPNRDWGHTIARQYLYDSADAIRLEALAGSSWKELAELVGVIRSEEAYHLDHARAWFARLADGPVEARTRFAAGLSAALPDALGMFEPLVGEDGLVEDGVLPRPHAEMLNEWVGALGENLEGVALDYVLEEHREPVADLVPTSSGDLEGEKAFAVPGIVRRDGRWTHEGGFAGAGGRRGRHSDDFPPLWEEMTGLYRAHPGARW